MVWRLDPDKDGQGEPQLRRIGQGHPPSEHTRSFKLLDALPTWGLRQAGRIDFYKYINTFLAKFEVSTDGQDDVVELVIGRLPLTRVKDAVALLTRAFMPDPIFSHYFPEDQWRAEVFRVFFSDAVRAHSRFGHVYAATMDDKIVAAAVWRPPDAGQPTARDLRRQTVTENRVRAIDPKAAVALFEGFAGLESWHPSEPHWYLFFTGVEPEMQGSGIGSRLLAPVLESADRSRVQCYLETPFPRTHGFYRRLGFSTSVEGNPFAGAPTLWAMTRAPN